MTSGQPFLTLIPKRSAALVLEGFSGQNEHVALSTAWSSAQAELSVAVSRHRQRGPPRAQTQLACGQLSREL